jgi:dihydrofolate reductase
MKAILACDADGGIGKNGSLPWPRISEDLKRFKELTTKQTVIMGRNTWEAPDMPHPLPNRANIIITSKKLEVPPGVITMKAYPTAIKHGWIIGGAALLSSTIQYVDELHLTRVNGTYDCDTFIDVAHLINNFALFHEEVYTVYTYQIWRRNEAIFK